MSVFSKWLSSKKAERPTSVELKKPQLSAANYCEQGQKSLDAGKYVEAMEYFQAAIETDKHFEKAYLLLATAYEKQEKSDKAKAALYSLLAVNPNHVEAMRRIEGLKEGQESQPVKFKTPVQTSQTNSPTHDKTSPSQPPKDDKVSNGNIGCLLFAVLFCVICAIALFSMDEFWGGLVMAFIALFTIYGHFTNPDFWK